VTSAVVSVLVDSKGLDSPAETPPIPSCDFKLFTRTEVTMLLVNEGEGGGEEGASASVVGRVVDGEGDDTLTTVSDGLTTTGVTVGSPLLANPV
jgi:hypothetical protein